MSESVDRSVDRSVQRVGRVDPTDGRTDGLTENLPTTPAETDTSVPHARIFDEAELADEWRRYAPARTTAHAPSATVATATDTTGGAR